ncbi:phenoloxidase-activating factor 2-like isoform X2 [Drosophila eugracilis]|uniref:phenoloxidase-activating factor 2-like isoform X2 n=1 Tax=Drosophila eugracilis TaxID=29029 RepID=UPI0007E70844|nr:phenoloxidase-activating factor 2-like isoform X2 [Drosophila eugracilis]
MTNYSIFLLLFCAISSSIAQTPTVMNEAFEKLGITQIKGTIKRPPNDYVTSAPTVNSENKFNNSYNEVPACLCVHMKKCETSSEENYGDDPKKIKRGNCRGVFDLCCPPSRVITSDSSEDEEYINKVPEPKGSNISVIMPLPTVDSNTNLNKSFDIPPTCECVEYHKCEPSSDDKNIDGSFNKFGTLNIRRGYCPNAMHLCCPVKQVQKETINPRPKEKLGCGIRNIGGIDCTIKGATQFESDIAEFPWTVAFMVNGNYSFAGSLIHPQVVLTTHRAQNWKTYTVRAGEWNFKSTGERLKYQEITVSRIIQHPEYNSINLANDVAFVILEKPFTLDDHINVICLPEQGTTQPSTTQCIANGWGKDAHGESGKFLAIMKKVTLPIVDSGDCQKRLRKTELGSSFTLDKSQICAGGQKGIDTCDGDGGGPLACPLGNLSDNRYQLNGIVSFGVGCNNEWPGGYSNVASFRDWIDRQMDENNFDKSLYTHKA